MDMSWMKIKDGVKQFLEFVCAHIEPGKKIRCPCVKCHNIYFCTHNDVEVNLYYHGIVKCYIPWVLHGEEFEASTDEDDDDEPSREDEDDHDDMQEMIHDHYTSATINAWVGEDSSNNENVVPDWDVDKFIRLLKDAEQKLYLGCEKFSKLSFIVKLLHIKTLNHWSSKSFTMLLELLKEALPDAKTLPKSFYEAKNIIRDLGLDYVRIHACKNDCVLFWKEHEHREECPKCKEPIYKFTNAKRNKIPQKILRYFPLKPRLQRLFISNKIASDMRWHKKKSVNDGVLRHPTDAETWKEFDKMHNPFSQDPCNVRLGLASDGFNLFLNMSTSHSTWPVVFVTCNLPPSKCMKGPFFIMLLLIPGPKSPRNEIDVYLRPLIDELKELWEDDIQTYDAYTGTNFQLHATMIWTINDFPAYDNLMGWSTKGFLYCRSCNKETSHTWLKNGKKTYYMSHRRFLLTDHIWRHRKSSFDGKKELRERPKSLSGDDVLEQLSHIGHVKFGKTQPQKRKHAEDLIWTKHSIFFKLPY